MAEHETNYFEFGPTYKSLFVGAVILISGAFGWWLTNFISAVDRIHREHAEHIAQCERGLAKLESRQDRGVWEHEALIKELERIKRTIEK